MKAHRIVLLSAGLALSTANAQDGDEPEARDDRRLEEVVVTAGFRDVDAMTSAGSVTVVDAATIRERAAKHLESVLHAAPNISYSGGASRARFVQVRGVGDLEQFVDPKHFPSVGLTVDDVNLGGTANAAMLFDAEQVEVLRGPQGTAFGTTALAGLVNIRGRRPTDAFETYVEAGAGNYSSWELGGVVSGPLGDGVGGRVAVQKNRSDGYIDNRFLGRDDTNDRDETFVRASLDIDPTDTSRYGFTALYFDGDNGYDAFSLDNTRETLTDDPGRDRQQSTALSGRGEWDVGADTQLEAIATWSSTDLHYAFDEDWSFVGLCDGTLCNPGDAFSSTDVYDRDRDEASLDVRLLGDFAPLDAQYVIGVYAQHRSEDLRRQYFGEFFSDYETNRRALYGQLTAYLTPALSLTAGLRYEQFDDAYADTFGFASASDDDLQSGELTLSYEAADGSLLYATLARGSKAGAVNTQASANFPFMQPAFQSFMQDRLEAGTEVLLNREIGFKGRYVSDRLSLRTALFHMQRDDAQLESWMWDADSALWIGFLDNVDGSNWGLETELSFDLSERVQLFGTVGWLETEVDAITTFDLDLGEFVVREGIEQAKAPTWQYHFGANLSLTDRIGLRLGAEGADDSRFGYYHAGRIDSFHLLNASLTYRTGAAQWQLWARNLTDEDYAVHGLYFGNDPRKGWVNETYYQYGEPRVAGVSVRYSFE